jgi:hypothetical protein
MTFTASSAGFRLDWHRGDLCDLGAFFLDTWHRQHLLLNLRAEVYADVPKVITGDCAVLNTLPETLADSTVTSLSDLVRSIPDRALDDHLDEQVKVLERAGLDLDEAAAYYSSLLHDRELFGKLGANYADPTDMDFVRLRLLAVYYIGLKHFSTEDNEAAVN